MIPLKIKRDIVSGTSNSKNLTSSIDLDDFTVENDISATSAKFIESKYTTDSSAENNDTFIVQMSHYYYHIFITELYPHLRTLKIDTSDYSFSRLTNKILRFGGQSVLHSFLNIIVRNNPPINIIRWIVYTLYKQDYKNIDQFAINFIFPFLNYKDFVTNDLVYDCLVIWKRHDDISFIKNFEIGNSIQRERFENLFNT